jgi:hypothetical protein
MWEGWNKYTDIEHIKTYGLLVGIETKFELTVGIHSVHNESGIPGWNVRVSTFAPSMGEYIVYEDSFSSFQEAEAKAWERAQTVLENAT